MARLLILAIATLVALDTSISEVFAAGPDLGAVQKQPLNWTAIVMFLVFVLGTLGITYRAAAQTKSAADFYAAGGGITGLQNGLAIAGDYMSAASFLGISGLVFASGFDGLIYSIGFLVGWPIVLFLIAERLRNLGKFTFSDVASFRLDQTQIRILSAVGTLVVVAFYLIAQMVGAGKLIELLFGLDYLYAVIIVGVLMIVYVAFGGMKATTWVQIIKACLLLAGATLMSLIVLWRFGFSPEAMFAEAVKIHPKGDAIMAPGALVADPISAISLGLALMFGTAGLPHILMRFFTVSDAQAARKSVFYATGFIAYFYILTFIIGFGAITFLMNDPSFFKLGAGGAYDKVKDLLGGTQHGRDPSRVRNRWLALSRFHLGCGVCNDPRRGGRAHPFRSLGGQSRPLCGGHRPRTGVGAEGGQHLEDLGHRHRDRRDHPGLHLREPERGLHGRPGLRGRGELQLPGSPDVGPLEGNDDPGSPDRRPAGPDQRGHHGGAEQGRLGADLRLCTGTLPLRQPGHLLHADRLPRDLGLFEARRQQPRQGGGRIL